MDPKRIRKERGRGPSFVKNATEPFLSNEKREDIPSINSNEETQSSGTAHLNTNAKLFFHHAPMWGGYVHTQKLKLIERSMGTTIVPARTNILVLEFQLCTGTCMS